MRSGISEKSLGLTNEIPRFRDRAKLLSVPEKAVALFCAAILLFATVLYNYPDSWFYATLTPHFWEALVQGGLYKYYEIAYNLPNTELLSPTPISPINLIIYGVWNFPLWIARYSFNIDITTAPLALLWSKTFILLFFGLFLNESWKLTYTVSEDISKSNFVTLLVMTSVFSLVSVGYAGQTDVIWMFVSLIAIRKYINKHYGKFLIYSMITIGLKPFFVIIFLGLVLLKEKRLLYLVRDFAIGITLYIIQRAYLNTVPFYDELNQSSNFGAELFHMLNAFTVNTAFGKVSVFILVLAVFYIYIYFFKRITDETSKLQIIKIILLITMFYVFLSKTTFYRPLMILPWLFIYLSSLSKSQFNMGILFASCLGFFMVLNFVASGLPLFDFVSFRNSMIVPQPESFSRTYEFSYQVLDMFNPIRKAGILNTSAILALVVALMVITLAPQKIQVDSSITWLPRIKGVALLGLRVFIMYAWVMYSVITYFL